MDDIYQIIDEINNSKITYEHQSDSVVFTKQMQKQIKEYIQHQVRLKENTPQNRNKQELIRSLNQKYNLSGQKRRDSCNQTPKQAVARGQKLQVKVMKGQAVIRVGGGYMTIQEYIQQQVAQKTVPIEENKVAVVMQPEVPRLSRHNSREHRQEYMSFGQFQRMR